MSLCRTGFIVTMRMTEAVPPMNCDTHDLWYPWIMAPTDVLVTSLVSPTAYSPGFCTKRLT